MKFVKRMHYLAFIPLLGLLWTVAFSGTAFAASSHPSSIASLRTQTAQPISTRMPAWAVKAQPFVHISNYTAVVDPTISRSLSAGDVAEVTSSVAHYNSLPLTLRQHPQHAGTVPASNVHPNIAWQWSWNLEWWGVRVWINSSLAQSFGTAEEWLGGAIGALVGSVLGVAGSAIGAIIGAMPGTVAILDDNYCGNEGVFIDIPWAIPLTHFTLVC